MASQNAESTNQIDLDSTSGLTCISTEIIHIKEHLKPNKTPDLIEIDMVITGDPVSIPLTIELLSAGFPSPAQDYIEKSIDLNEMLITHESATFMGKVGSLSMLNAGIDVNDKLLIDRSLDPKHFDIVVAQVDNEFTVKRLMFTKQMTADEISEVFGAQYDIKKLPTVWLKAENPEFQHIFLKDGQELVVWGVVTYIIKATRK